MVGGYTDLSGSTIKKTKQKYVYLPLADNKFSSSFHALKEHFSASNEGEKILHSKIDCSV